MRVMCWHMAHLGYKVKWKGLDVNEATIALQ